MTISRITLSLETQSVIGLPVTALPFEGYVENIIHWAHFRLSKVVCVANVHMLTEAQGDKDLATVLHQADLVTPDGMPLVWMLQILRQQSQDRAAGMDLLLASCREASKAGIPVFFVGAEQSVLDRMRVRLRREFPDLRIGGMESLPFGELPLPEAAERPVIEKIKASRSGIVFVSLGCPKQEKWMHEHREQIPAVMIGIGGVFPIYAGILSHAPRVMRDAGFEWLYRLIQEPRRLWMRYTRTIPPFIGLASLQLLRMYLGKGRSMRSARRRRRAETVPAIGTEVTVLGGRVIPTRVSVVSADKLPSVDRN
jgi:N-acetylglucosaminyldiphosphoundecaprenol N-acetyl-beta-D-mannosaminyltransferase